MNVWPKRWMLMVRLLCAMAFVLSGYFVQTVAASETTQTAGFYRLPDGSLATICDDGHGTDKQTASGHCLSCLTVTAHALFNPVVHSFAAPNDFILVGWRLDLFDLPSQLSFHANSRAPPVLT
ncbi:MAG: hypothetical protein RLZZ444_3103 [Pseudomonadota bacterium]